MLIEKSSGETKSLANGGQIFKKMTIIKKSLIGSLKEKRTESFKTFGFSEELR